jgi:hypothetical protein
MVAVEQRNRRVFAEPTAAAGESDLLLVYSFPLLVSLDKNLELFREFSGKERGRLRGTAPGKG